MAENTVSDVNGRRHEISRGKGVYGGRWDLAAKDDEITRLTTQLAQARVENTQLRQGLKRGQVPTNTYSPPGTRKGGGGKGGRGGQKDKPGGKRPSDPAYVAKRNQMCVKYNLHTCADAACPNEHACSRRVSQGQVCGLGHPSKDHV